MRFSAELQLAEVYVIARSRKKGFEDEGFGSSGAEFEIAVDANVSDAGFGAAVGRIEEVLRIGDGGSSVNRAFQQALGCIGADELGPVAGEQVGVRKDVGPDFETGAAASSTLALTALFCMARA